MVPQKRIKFIEMKGEEVVVREEQILKFQTEIEKLVRGDSITYLEAINDYCETHQIEIDTIKSLISSSMLAKITKESQELNLIKGEERLPI